MGARSGEGAVVPPVLDAVAKLYRSIVEIKVKMRQCGLSEGTGIKEVGSGQGATVPPHKLLVPFKVATVQDAVTKHVEIKIKAEFKDGCGPSEEVGSWGGRM